MADQKANGLGAASLDDLTMWQIAALALYELGGARQRFDSEDIAVRCHKLSPGRFGWKKLRHLPNLGAASEALNDARRARNGALIVGSPTAHWMLTAAGIGWVQRHQHLLRSDNHHQPTQLTARERRELADIRSHAVYTRWQAGGEPPQGNRIASALLISASSPPGAVERRLEQLTSFAELSGETELKEYIAWLNAAFAANR